MHSRLAYYLHHWRLKVDGDSIDTASSLLLPVLHGNERCILKLLKPSSDEQNATTCLTYWQGNGAVHLMEHDSEALLLERLETVPSLKEMSLIGMDDESAAIIAMAIKRLHSATAKLPALPMLEHRFRSLFQLAEQSSALPMHKKASELAQSLVTLPAQNVVLHGDIHHDNIMHSQRGWLAIDPKGVIGHPAYDAANALRNPIGAPYIVHDKERMLRHADIYASALELDKMILLEFAFVDACLSAAWSLEDGESPDYAMECAGLLHSLL